MPRRLTWLLSSRRALWLVVPGLGGWVGGSCAYLSPPRELQGMWHFEERPAQGWATISTLVLVGGGKNGHRGYMAFQDTVLREPDPFPTNSLNLSSEQR